MPDATGPSPRRATTAGPVKALELKGLDEFLLARAMEHDSPSLLFRLACEHLTSSRVVRAGGGGWLDQACELVLMRWVDLAYACVSTTAQGGQPRYGRKG